MNRRNKAREPEPVGGLGFMLALALTLMLAGVALALGWKGLWWLLPSVLVGGALLVCLVWTAPGHLSDRVGMSGLRIRTFAGVREVKRGNVKAARKVSYRLGIRLYGTEPPGHNVGRFRNKLGTVQAFVRAKRGPGVLLELTSGEKLLINPCDPERRFESLGIEL
ncbi:hypothetical protein [Oceanithermus sp.]